jgi:hypothetical protein
MGEGSFYSSALRTHAQPRRGWDGMDELGAAALGAHARSGRSEAAMTWESHEGHARAFCLYVGVGCLAGQEWGEGWPCGRQARASEWCLLD